MKHLTVDEIIDFVSLDKITPTSLETASKVTTHIRSCSECLRKTRAYQVVYDEFVRLGKKVYFRKAALKLGANEGTFDQSASGEESMMSVLDDK